MSSQSLPQARGGCKFAVAARPPLPPRSMPHQRKFRRPKSNQGHWGTESWHWATESFPSESWRWATESSQQAACGAVGSSTESTCSKQRVQGAVVLESLEPTPKPKPRVLEHWTEVTDAGKVYFWNQKTNETRWELNDSQAACGADAAAASKRSKNKDPEREVLWIPPRPPCPKWVPVAKPKPTPTTLPPNWTEVNYAGAKVYYWNQKTDEVTWEKPGSEGADAAASSQTACGASTVLAPIDEVQLELDSESASAAASSQGACGASTAAASEQRRSPSPAAQAACGASIATIGQKVATEETLEAEATAALATIEAKAFRQAISAVCGEDSRQAAQRVVPDGSRAFRQAILAVYGEDSGQAAAESSRGDRSPTSVAAACGDRRGRSPTPRPVTDSEACGWREPPKCLRCGEAGHNKNECPQNENLETCDAAACGASSEAVAQAESQVTHQPRCFKCGGWGHFARQCCGKGDAAACGASSEAVAQAESQVTHQPRCFKCGGWAHLARHCCKGDAETWLGGPDAEVLVGTTRLPASSSFFSNVAAPPSESTGARTLKHIHSTSVDGRPLAEVSDMWARIVGATPTGEPDWTLGASPLEMVSMNVAVAMWIGDTVWAWTSDFGPGSSTTFLRMLPSLVAFFHDYPLPMRWYVSQPNVQWLWRHSVQVPQPDFFGDRWFERDDTQCPAGPHVHFGGVDESDENALLRLQ